MKKKYDFSGWATRNGLKCSDGRTIIENAFAQCNGKEVPLVWNHQHNDPANVLGHGILENRKEGVYIYGTFNDTENARTTKALVENGDIVALSIWANQLKQQGGNVLHGDIKEVSMVLSGANPGAFIEEVIRHGENFEEEAVIYTGETLEIYHAETAKKQEDTKLDNNMAHADGTGASDKTVAEVFATLNEEQKTVVYALIGQALDNAGVAQSGMDYEGDYMKHNIFDNDDTEDSRNVLSHADMMSIMDDARRYGSLKDAVISHGITDIDYLFPDATLLDTPPSFITRDLTWVSMVMNGTHHTPFSRIKSLFANLTEAEARAKGYIKGNLKVEEVFSLLKRTTTPTTVYKKQKLDRDDVVDIVDFDVVAWLKSEMRLMLDEEIARAVLVGDGRLGSSDDKILETNIRPIWTDSDLYTIKTAVTVTAGSTDDEISKAFIRAAVKSRKNYKGSGNPGLYCTEDVLTNCLLLEDSMGRVIYESVDKLATALRVKSIVTVPVMENLTRTDDASKQRTLMGLIVNLSDYNIGADKGGAVNMFDDFDIDYNQQKYLIETRCSGALTKPYSAIAMELITETA